MVWLDHLGSYSFGNRWIHVVVDSVTKISIIREPDDPIAEVRISLGSPKGVKDFYLVFRGDPDKVVELLETAHTVARAALPEGMYEDQRGL
jgi:hypothetical protein